MRYMAEGPPESRRNPVPPWYLGGGEQPWGPYSQQDHLGPQCSRPCVKGVELDDLEGPPSQTHPKFLRVDVRDLGWTYLESKTEGPFPQSIFSTLPCG